MSVSKGFRFGTKPETFSSNPDGWVYIKGKGEKYDEIRKNNQKQEAIERKLLSLEAKLEKCLVLTRYLRAAIVGGHVEKRLVGTATSIMNENTAPEDGLRSILGIIKSDN